MYQLRYREELPQPVVRELDDFIAFLQHYLGVALNEDGTLRSVAITEANNQEGTTPVASGASPVEDGERHWWKRGPWEFDDPDSTTPHVAEIVPVFTSGAQTINDWAPQGIDTCVIITILTGVSGNIILTGMKAPSPRRRRLVLMSNLSAFTVTLKNTNTGSQPTNRFFTGTNVSATTDIVLGPGQNIWLFWNGGGWSNAITPQLTGGTFGEGSTSFPTTVTNALSTTPVFSFNTATIDALNGTPQVLIAGVAGKIIVPVSVVIRASRSGAWTNSGTALRVQYTGQTQGLTASPSTTGMTGAGAGTFTGWGVQANITVTGGGVNAGVEVTCTSDANPGAQTGQWDVQIAYFLMSTAL